MNETRRDETKTVALPQGTISYRDLGDGEPIIFVHGLLVDGRLWTGVAERLASDFRCLVCDWPMGSHRVAMEPDADLSPPGMAETIVAFIDALGIERATLVGNDTGGAISQILTASHPERVERLVLTNCDLLDRFPPFPFNLMPPIARLPGGMTVLAAPFRIAAVRRATYGLLAKHPIPPELADDWLAPSLADAGVLRDARKLTAGAHKRHTLAAAESLRRFERPVRFAWAPEDRFFRLADAERLAAMVPDGRIEHVADAKTFVSLDQPQRVAELIASFAREARGATARAS
ncbi:MAG: alpha/beta hydrolase fold protein [Solirubrobacterales bacterium]|jgi:pimeloyl-ACP methyl ester carboxylesterase|nr:alpha/beta hydrolase fold protein [Solirubrobacterales bacterium]